MLGQDLESLHTEVVSPAVGLAPSLDQLMREENLDEPDMICQPCLPDKEMLDEMYFSALLLLFPVQFVQRPPLVLPASRERLQVDLGVADQLVRALLTS